MSISALVKHGSLSPEGLKSLELIIQETVSRNGGVRALAAKASNLQDSADSPLKNALGSVEQLCSDAAGDRVSKDTVHRLCHISTGDRSSSLLLKLKFLAPYTLNRETGQPFTFEELIAIARGDRQVALMGPKEVGRQFGFFRSEAETGNAASPPTMKSSGKRGRQPIAARSAKPRAKKGTQGGNMANTERKSDLFAVIEEAVALHGREAFLAETAMRSAELDAILLCRCLPSRDQLGQISLATPPQYTLADLIEMCQDEISRTSSDAGSKESSIVNHD